jgi:DNA-binding winged helix-turn-helix (wHTH) protein
MSISSGAQPGWNHQDGSDAANSRALRWRVEEGMRVSWNTACAYLTVNGEIISLSPTQCRLVATLLERLGQPVAVEELLQSAYPWERGVAGPLETRRLHRHMCKLRARLGVFQLLLHSVPGYGYVLLRATDEKTKATAQDQHQQLTWGESTHSSRNVNALRAVPPRLAPIQRHEGTAIRD